jgi:hypothetical protein
MRTHIYEVQKGDKVLPQFIGAKVELQNATTMAEALSSGQFENEAAFCAAAARDRNIIANRAVRQALSKLQDGETPPLAIARAAKLANAVKVGAARVGKTPATAKPKTVQKNVAASSGTRLFEKMLASVDFRRKMIGDGIADEAEYNVWRTAKEAAAVQAATPAGNGGATVQAAPVAETSKVESAKTEPKKGGAPQTSRRSPK